MVLSVKGSCSLLLSIHLLPTFPLAVPEVFLSPPTLLSHKRWHTVHLTLHLSLSASVCFVSPSEMDKSPIRHP
jgi:hypothetical protein